jgi:maltose O-acetyltransferase
MDIHDNIADRPPHSEVSGDPCSPKQRMLAGEQYIADDPELVADQMRCAQRVRVYNETSPADCVHRAALLRELLGSVGADTVIRSPLQCDYGYQTTIGARSFANWGLVLLDVGRITIGNDVQFGPNVQLLTATHPIQPGPRRDKWEAAEPVTIGDNVWLGGGVIVLPGVTIGSDTVVGAGAVVTGDLPAGVVAVGNPARIIRQL